MPQQPEAGDFLIEEWFAAGSAPGNYGIGFQVFLDGAVNIAIQDQTGKADVCVVPVGAFQIIRAMLSNMFSMPDVEIPLPHGTGDVNRLGMRLDSASGDVVFTMFLTSTGAVLGTVYLARGYAVSTIDTIFNAVNGLNSPATAPAGTFSI